MMDMYLTIGPWLASDVIQTGTNSIKGTLTSNKADATRSVVFRTQGRLDVQLYPNFLDLSTVYIGSQGLHPDSRAFTLSPDDPAVAGPQYSGIEKKGGMSITYDSESAQWTVSNISNAMFLDFIIQSTHPIEGLTWQGFQPFRETGVDALLMRREDAFARQPLSGAAGADTACHSVTAGDFDNDMDVDLYLVCSGAVENRPNRLLENDGKGNFQPVPQAGGAAGSKLGRGDVVAAADYDRNGFLDLFVTNGMDPTSPFVADGQHQLFRNAGNSNHWLEIDLEGVQSNRDGIGATVSVEAGGITQIRKQSGGMHRIAQNFQRLHFGLGGNPKADKVTIRWPSGAEQVLSSVAADRILRIREDASSLPR
jgi:hypothetical protein